jgi:glycerol-3-phosphate acyltransferase PlsY
MGTSPVAALAAYLCGSVNFAILISRLVTKDDIRNYGSGNAGATNMLRAKGPGLAALTMAGDLLKAVVAVEFARWFAGFCAVKTAAEGLVIDPTFVAAYVAGLFCIIGHLYPLYFGFRGGKGVVATLGMYLVLDWKMALLCLGLFIVVVAITKWVSLGSILGVLPIPALTFLSTYVIADTSLPTALFCTVLGALVSLTVIIKHIPNIRRLLDGTESKLSFKKKEG